MWSSVNPRFLLFPPYGGKEEQGKNCRLRGDVVSDAKLPADVQADVQRILDRVARRLLEEKLNGRKPAPNPQGPQRAGSRPSAADGNRLLHQPTLGVPILRPNPRPSRRDAGPGHARQ
jgi:hypothetical protein